MVLRPRPASNRMKGFQIGILIFFGFFVFLGVLIFSGAIKLGGNKSAEEVAAAPTLTIWGTLPSKKLAPAIALSTQGSGMQVKYVAKDPRTYEEDILNAFAFGGLPDAFLMSQDLIFKYEDKLINIPFTYFPERTYDDSFVRAAEIFKKGQGFLGFPIFVDPLIMYYNQDILESKGYTEPPTYWSDLFEYVPKLTSINEALKIDKAGVALGEFENVKNAKEIFVALMLQLDNPIVARNPANGKFAPVLGASSAVSSKPAIQSMDFYGEFSDPTKSVYSWNKSMESSDKEFISGDLAIYFGLTSEFENIRLRNPNLNFDIHQLPQVKELPTVITYADVYALSIPSNSPKAQMALAIASSLANGPAAAGIAGASGFAPVRRDLISAPNQNKYGKIYYAAALSSRSWVDPDDKKTTEIFSQMFEDVLSGLSSTEDAIMSASTELKLLLQK